MYTKIYAIMSTLLECGGCPESQLYIFFDMNMDIYTQVRNMLVDSGMIQVKGYYVTLTDKGKIMAAELDAAVKKARG